MNSPYDTALNLLFALVIVLIIVACTLYFLAFKLFLYVFNPGDNRFVFMLIVLGTIFLLTGISYLMFSESDTAKTFCYFSFNKRSCKDTGESYKTYGTIFTVSSIVIFLLIGIMNFLSKPKNLTTVNAKLVNTKLASTKNIRQTQ